MKSDTEPDSNIKEQADRIVNDYGYLLTLEDIAAIFKYKSVTAVCWEKVKVKLDEMAFVLLNTAMDGVG